MSDQTRCQENGKPVARLLLVIHPLSAFLTLCDYENGKVLIQIRSFADPAHPAIRRKRTA